MSNAIGKAKKVDPIIRILADKWRKTPRYIRMVRDGERTNDEIFEDYMALKEGFSLMINAVRKAVPF